MEEITAGEHRIPVLRTRVAVVGSGAAGYGTADALYEAGVRDILIVTEGRLMGTSRNTGSDKQTYYKLNMAGGIPDSVYDMALRPDARRFDARRYRALGCRAVGACVF